MDWLVELMNLYIKVIYGGAGYTRTWQLVLKQSPLIEVFRKIHTNMRNNFFLLNRTIRHAPPSSAGTIEVLCDQLKKHRAHEFQSGRSAATKQRDHFREGMRILQMEKLAAAGVFGDEHEGDNSDLTAEDITTDDLEID